MTADLASLADPVQAYRTLAFHLFSGQTAEPELPAAVQVLPPLDQTFLEALAGEAQQAAWSQPRRSWALMATADAAAKRTNDLFLKSLAAWHLAYAANAWVRPQRVEAAVARAREGFTALGRDDWLAACTWQLNALPWTRPDFKQTVQELTEAIASLQGSTLCYFVADCRLALAFAQMLMGNYDVATRLAEESHHSFMVADDPLGQGRCQLLFSSILRRQTRYDLAEKHLVEALAIFSQPNAPLLIAQVYYQLGFITWLLHGDFRKAEAYLKQALQQFESADIPLWQALCYHVLGQVYNDCGRLDDAHKTLQPVREIYGRYQLYGPLADTLFDSGISKMLRGDYQESIRCFQQAAQLYHSVGYPTMLAVCTMHEGEAHLQLGNYQTSLGLLEQAYTSLHSLNLPWRLAECEERLAAVWLALGQYSRADEHLSHALNHFEQAGRHEQLAEIQNKRATVLARTNQVQTAIATLHQAIAVAAKVSNYGQRVTSHRLLAELLDGSGHSLKAREHLQAAAQRSSQLGLRMEQRATYHAWGVHHTREGDYPAARAAWNQALSLSKEAAPELLWQVHQGLATLANKEQDPLGALSQYRQAVQALTNLRRSLWQPELIGTYLNRPVQMFDQAVDQAAQIGAIDDLLYFMEESKAQTIFRQWTQTGSLTTQQEAKNARLETAKQLLGEVHWLRQKIQEKSRETGRLALSTDALYDRLVQTVQEYEQAMGQWERAINIANRERQTANPVLPHFTLSDFRPLADAAAGDEWLALSYYQTKSHIYGIMISPATVREWSVKITASITFALNACTRGRHWPTTQLATLGKWLFPDFVQRLLAPGKIILIAPHRNLHRLPWAAILVTEQTVPLAAAAVPVILPALKSLRPLLERPATPSSTRGGLVVAVSEFGERHTSLPEVIRETLLLSDGLLPAVTVLREGAATFDRLTQLTDEGGLSSYPFLHIATHAFADDLTGRLISLALADRDVSLDELWQLAPLPPLVTLSACSGLASRRAAGDEPVGLAMRCLAAGSKQVIGSLWRVADVYAPDLMANLYQYLISGGRPSLALALAQREGYTSGVQQEHWGSFQCIGLP